MSVHSLVCIRSQRKNYFSKPIVEEGEEKKKKFQLLTKQINEMLIVDTHLLKKKKSGH